MESKQQPTPQRYNNLNNPYKKITTYSNTLGMNQRYSNDVSDLYRNEYNNFHNSRSTSNSYDSRKNLVGDYDKDYTKVFYRRGNGY